MELVNYLKMSLGTGLLLFVGKGPKPKTKSGFGELMSLTVNSSPAMGYYEYPKVGIGNTCVCPVTLGKPILRPLADIKKVISHKGEDFIPEERLNSAMMALENWEAAIKHGLILAGERDKLIEWHFDLGDFIYKGEAYSIHSFKDITY